MAHMPTTGSGPAGANSIIVQDEGIEVSAAADTLNFVGIGVQAVEFVAGVVTVTVSGGGGGGGGTFSGQLFQYVVTGLEGDLSALTITLPVAELSTGYLVFVTQEQATYQLGYNVQNASKGLGSFVLTLSGLATANDIFSFMVIQP